jgi:hypothetical protein
MPGNVFDDREHAALEQPLAHRSGKLRDATRLGPVGSVADNRVRPGNGDVGYGQAIDCDTERFEVIRHQPRGEPSRQLGLRVRQRPKASGGRVEAPERRPKPSHASALLVDQDWSITAPDRVAQRCHEVPDLVGRAAIAPEQDETDGIGIAEEAAFIPVQTFSGAAQNDRAGLLPGRCSGVIGQ